MTSPDYRTLKKIGTTGAKVRREPSPWLVLADPDDATQHAYRLIDRV